MDALDKLYVLTMELSSANDPYRIESMLTGSVAVWNVPSASSDILQTLVRAAVQKEGAKGAATLTKGKVRLNTDLYALTFDESVTDGHRSNLRFGLRYQGPVLAKPIAGIHTTKEQVATFLKKTVEAQVKHVKLLKTDEMSVKPEQIVDVAVPTRYTRLVGKFSGYQMVFKVLPQKEMYRPMIQELMPLTVDNIVITRQGSDPGMLIYTTNAAGRPFLNKVGKRLDAILQVAIHQREKGLV